MGEKPAGRAQQPRLPVDSEETNTASTAAGRIRAGGPGSAGQEARLCVGTGPLWPPPSSGFPASSVRPWPASAVSIPQGRPTSRLYLYCRYTYIPSPRPQGSTQLKRSSQPLARLGTPSCLASLKTCPRQSHGMAVPVHAVRGWLQQHLFGDLPLPNSRTHPQVSKGAMND